jgi:predicted transcriptional regulator
VTARHAEPTKAEFNVLRALWRLGQGTVAEVKTACAALHGGDPAYTTVMTLLGRLEAKQLVKVDKVRQPFLYKPKVREAAVARSRLRDLVDTLFEGDASELVLQLVRDEALSPADLKRIEAKIAAREAGGERR